MVMMRCLLHSISVKKVNQTSRPFRNQERAGHKELSLIFDEILLIYSWLWTISAKNKSIFLLILQYSNYDTQIITIFFVSILYEPFILFEPNLEFETSCLHLLLWIRILRLFSNTQLRNPQNVNNNFVIT